MPVEQVLGHDQAQELGIAQDGSSTGFACPVMSQIRQDTIGE